MKKFFVVAIIAILSLGVIGVVKSSYAVNATEAVNPEAEPIIVYGQSRSRPSNGDSSIGIAKLSTEPTKKMGLGQVFNGIGRVYSVTIYSDTAGDLVGLYDIGAVGGNYYGAGASVTNSLEFEIAIAANTSSTTVYLQGAKFENGLFIAASDAANTKCGVVYDY